MLSRTTQPKHTGTRTEGKTGEKKNQWGLRIGFHFMPLITFAFYCVTEETMEMSDENSGDAQA